MAFADPLLRKRKRAGKVKILDAGCGPGNLIARLIRWGDVVGTDASADALTFCQQKHAVPVIQTLIKDMPFADNTFDFIFALEVIEHIEDDIEAMRELYRILKPNGFLITTVPAFMFLWGYHDEKYGHFRRYTKPSFCRLAVQAGFKVKKSRYFKILFFLPLLFIRKFKTYTSQKNDDFYQISPFVNWIFRQLIKAEIPIVSAIDLPLGVSLIVSVQRGQQCGKVKTWKKSNYWQQTQLTQKTGNRPQQVSKS
jgi:SAM-dependent methyltransferase